ncbi:hypothetical protein F5Y02DRAFT_429430 [Annulohypoxylon stygium]|nr:hypothetical protein F5Y02DRAFT_429430 [Annulohypoxylon stygium]
MPIQEPDMRHDVLDVVFSSVSQSRTVQYINGVQEYLRVTKTCIVPLDFAGGILGMMRFLCMKIHSQGPMRKTTLSKLVDDISHSTALETSYGGDEDYTYFNQFTGDNLRWESIGLFYALVASSTVHARQIVENPEISDIVEASSSCVEICRESGPVNEICVLSIYQNLMAISQIYGDKNCRTWTQLRRLANSLVKSGLYNHEKRAEIPPHIIELRRCLFAASWNIDKTICAALGRPPIIALRSPGMFQAHNEDFWGWTISVEYCAVTWVKLRYALNEMRARLKGIQGPIGIYSKLLILSVVNDDSLMWDSLQKQLKYSIFDTGAATRKHARQMSLLLASISLDYLFIKLEAYDRIGRFHSADE